MSSSVLRAGQSRPSQPVPSAVVFGEIENIHTGAVSLSYEKALAAVVEAQEQAERILREADADAIRIRAEAAEEAERVLTEARETGYAEGRLQAEQEARVAIAAGIEAGVATEAAALREDVEAFCEAIIAEQQRIWSDIETQLKDLALEIAERVVKAELTVNADVVVQITQHAMRRLADKDHVRIRVNPDDVERLRDHRDEIMALFEGLRSVEILEDRRVAIGGVQIETDTGMVDARIETQLSELTRALDV